MGVRILTKTSIKMPSCVNNIATLFIAQMAFFISTTKYGNPGFIGIQRRVFFDKTQPPDALKLVITN